MRKFCSHTHSANETKIGYVSISNNNIFFCQNILAFLQLTSSLQREAVAAHNNGESRVAVSMSEASAVVCFSFRFNWLVSLFKGDATGIRERAFSRTVADLYAVRQV